MNYNERYYRKIMGSIGLTMLLFYALINVFAVAIVVFESLLAFFDISDVAATVAYELFYGAGYLLSFMLPVLLLKALIGKSSYPYKQMYTSFKISPWALLLIPAGIALIYSAAYVNAGFVSIFDYSDFSAEYLWGTPSGLLEPYHIVLQFIVMCAVPGFCEEFLFRGAILTNCLPFGKTSAIMISSFLFAMMHQNPEQILYTFVAGIVLAVLYEKTKRIWPGTVLHILNNFSSVMQGIIFEKYGYDVFGSVWASAFEIIILFLGILSLAVIIIRFFSKKRDFSNGIYQRDFSVAESYASCSVAPKQAVRLFLTPSMLIFLILSALQMLILLLMAVLHGIFA